ncbi:hypothetical protein PINS_up022932 [Pythium insidiosum]|nr:hypothetical protein PINS_up022932 [Pythium insidiosum]
MTDENSSPKATEPSSTPEAVDDETRVLLHDERSCIFETRVERAAKCRDRGSAQFKAKDVARAIQWYERALFHVDFDEGTWFFEFMDKHRDAVNEVRLPVHLNLAMCYLLDGSRDLAKVVEHADAALAIEPDNAKALYRCGKAHLLNDNLHAAHEKLKRAAQQQPQDKNIREALQLLAEKKAEYKAKEKERWGGRLLNASSGGASDDDDDDSKQKPEPTPRDKPVAATDSPSNSTTSGMLSRSSWLVPLIVLLLAFVTGAVLMLTRQAE